VQVYTFKAETIFQGCTSLAVRDKCCTQQCQVEELVLQIHQEIRVFDSNGEFRLVNQRLNLPSTDSAAVNCIKTLEINIPYRISLSYRIFNR